MPLKGSNSPKSNNGENPSMLKRLLAPRAHNIFAGIYENLLTSDPSSRPKLVLVCSPSSGEGATTVATGLAMATAAQTKRPVLLIDGNSRRPGIFRLLDVRSSEHSEAPSPSIRAELVVSGIWRAESDETAVAPSQSAAGICWTPVQTNIPNLWAMDAGRDFLSQFHMIESPSFRDVMDELLKDYAFAILDGPPIIAFPESILYASQVDLTLLVIQAGVTRIPVASKALSKLLETGHKRVEIVLNRRVFFIPQAIYKRL